MIKTRPFSFVCLCFLLIQIILLVVSGGNTETEIPTGSVFHENKERTVTIHGQVYKKTNTSNIQILYLKNNSTIDSKIMVYDEKFTEVAIGQRILLRGKTKSFDCSRNPGNFDQRAYYAKQNIHGMIWCDKVVTVTGKSHWLLEGLQQVKMKWKNLLQEALGEKEGNILAAMLLGERNDMEPDIKELYQKNGIGHILAISGLHISFIGLGIYKLIRKTGAGYILSGVISIFILSLYAMMIGCSVSVIRAYIMLVFRIGADMSGRVYDMVTALLVAAAITVGIQPLYLTDAAFLLSYGAILGILFILPCLEKMFPCRINIFSALKASVAINVMLFPIILWFYFEIPIYSLVLNCMVIPLTSILLAFGIIGSLLGFVLWPVGKGCLFICKLILSVFEFLGTVGKQLPFWRVVLGQPRFWQIIIYYFLLVTCIILIQQCVTRKRLYIARLVFCMCIGVGILLVAYRPQGNLTVTMLDVGQGDGIFLRGPKGNTYFIDGGSSDVEQLGKYRIEPFLQSQGVGKLDYVFVSHGDKDHYGGIKELLERQEMGVKIKHLVLPMNWKQDENLVDLAETAIEEQVSVVVMKAGQNIREGTLQITCVQPSNLDQPLTGNAGSMVLSVRFNEFSMLCTGDVEAKGEDVLTSRLSEQEFTVLKVAHHGSKNSSSERFLKTIRPEIALVSAGENNSYGHPHNETMKRLKAMGCDIFTTTQNGAITLQTDGNTLTIDCFLY